MQAGLKDYPDAQATKVKLTIIVEEPQIKQQVEPPLADTGTGTTQASGSSKDFEKKDSGQTPVVKVFQVTEAAIDAANGIRAISVEDQSVFSATPVPRIAKATQTGQLSIRFSVPLLAIDVSLIDLSKLEYEESPGVWMPVLSVEVKPSSEQESDKIQIKSFEVTSMTPTQMEMQIWYSDALLISYSASDTIVVTFNDENLFITPNGAKIREEHRELRRELMRQLRADDISLQEKINDGASASKSATFFLLLPTVLLSVGLQFLFDMVNCLQIIILLPLLKSNIPANANMFIAFLTQIAAFDIVEIGDYVEQ